MRLRDRRRAGRACSGGAALPRPPAAYFAPRTITAYFVSATGIYPGDEVRVAGVKVGTIASIEPVGAQAKMMIHVDRDVPIPADAKAVIVAQSLVAARYVQLAPAYETSGPTMADGAVIPVDRTAIPVEWDEVKAQLTRLATDLGPRAACPARRYPGSSTALPTRWTATATSCGRRSRNCPRWGAPWPTVAATSSTSSRICRPSSPRCVTAISRSCSSKTGSPP